MFELRTSSRLLHNEQLRERWPERSISARIEMLVPH
jgi:hypothetical protein